MDPQLFHKYVFRSIAITCVLLAGEIASLVLLHGLISSKTAQIIERRALVASFQQEKSNFDALQADYLRVQPFLPTLSAALVPPENLHRVIAAIENAGIPLGLSLSLKLESQIPSATGIEGVRYVFFSATFDGTYAKLREYLKALQALPVFVDIDSIKIGGQLITTGGTVRVHGKIYLQ